MAEPEPGDTKEAGCALCGSSWGNWWEEAEGKRLFFCCSICAVAYQDAIRHVKRLTGWPRVDRLYLEDVRGNEGEGWARDGHGERVTFWLTGEDSGQIMEMRLT